MIDTHCHLTHPRLADEVESILDRALDAGVRRCITIGTGVDDARVARDLALRHPGRVAWAAGIDPFSAHEAGTGFDAELRRLERLLRSGGVVALGEIGLDFHYDLDPAAVQIERLERQLDLARTLDLPVVLHVREAHSEMIDTLAGAPGSRGVVHSFTAGPPEAERYLELGWFLAFNGVLTFPSAEEVREAARLVPPERLLVETDSPYLAPVPVRGRRCEPAFVAHTLRYLADLRGELVEIAAESTTANAIRLFRLDAAPDGRRARGAPRETGGLPGSIGET